MCDVLTTTSICTFSLMRLIEFRYYPTNNLTGEYVHMQSSPSFC